MKTVLCNTSSQLSLRLFPTRLPKAIIPDEGDVGKLIRFLSYSMYSQMGIIPHDDLTRPAIHISHECYLT
jgi:hypothetical protein